MASSASECEVAHVGENPTCRLHSLRACGWPLLVITSLVAILTIDAFGQERSIGRATLSDRAPAKSASKVELGPIEPEEASDERPPAVRIRSPHDGIRQANLPNPTDRKPESQKLIRTSQQSAKSTETTQRPDSDRTETDSSTEKAEQKADQKSEPWWHKEVRSQTRDVPATVPISLETLLLSALSNSSQVRVYKELPLIRETAIYEADAAFDSASFVESRWDDTNDPVGNLLTTGGAKRYKNDQWSGAAGLRKRTRVGGTLEVSERFGWQTTNSIYFQPPVQGTSKLALSYAQPLLRGRGKYYNESLIVLASIDSSISQNEFNRQLQSHLLEVSRAYWNLYLERANLVQKQRAMLRASKVLDQLSARADLDAVDSQIQRAEAEVATRESDLLRAEMAVENVEANIRTLVNDPALGESEAEVELLPMEMPSHEKFSFDMQTALKVALEMRPEIEQAFRQVKAGMVRADMSKNELLPALTLVTEAYVAGLQGGGSIGDAFLDQFRVGAPGYAVGLQLEVPLGNRAALSRNDRRLYELRQLRNEYESTISTVSLEVEVAVREVETSYNEMRAQLRAMIASKAQYTTLMRRWELLPGEDSTASLMLENLLIAQERLMRSEIAFTQAWTTYNLALINQRKATGELLQYYGVSGSDYLKEYRSYEGAAPHEMLPSASESQKADQSIEGPRFGQKKEPAGGKTTPVAAKYETAPDTSEHAGVQVEDKTTSVKASPPQVPKTVPARRWSFIRPTRPKPQ